MIQIVSMTHDHISQIAQLEKLCFSDPWSENAFSSELTNPLSLWLVAVDGDTVAGYVGSQAVLDQADVMNIAVAEAYRRQGIAERLVNALISELNARNVCALLLEVRASNLPAQKLYEKLGFQQVGRRPNYYTKPKEDALILRKEWQCENSGN